MYTKIVFFSFNDFWKKTVCSNTILIALSKKFQILNWEVYAIIITFMNYESKISNYFF